MRGKISTCSAKEFLRQMFARASGVGIRTCLIGGAYAYRNFANGKKVVEHQGAFRILGDAGRDPLPMGLAKKDSIRKTGQVDPA